ncbi:MAG: 23S rRNA (guanosine(2251)-2'-O)-methyltransferase RlmB [Nitrospirota bacterium]|jgi:23S rRNA (guanosine2251-2'-O)-methyltransferase
MSRQSSWLYGLNPVREALRSGRPVKTLHLYSGRQRGVAELREEAQRLGVPVKTEPSEFFDSRFPKGHQGVAAEVILKGYATLDELLAVPGERGEEPFFVVLDQVEDPRNLGAVLRTAEAAGVHGVVIQRRRQAGLGPEAAKASAGASEHLAVAAVSNVKHALDEMKAAGITIAGAEAEAEALPWEVGLSGPLALVVGSEGSGLRRVVRERCDVVVGLPMRGRVNSLNTSVAAGVLIYEALRQRLARFSAKFR